MPGLHSEALDFRAASESLGVVSDHCGDTFRSVYTVRSADRVFVLHAFQKTSKSGIATPQADIDLIRQRLTQASAAEVLNLDQPKVSALVRGGLAGFSLDRLVRFLVLLGSDVEIIVKPRARTAGRARVLVA